MERFLVVLFALCVAPSIASADFLADPLLLEGSMYCDTCKCGFETPASTRIAGAFGKVVCRTMSDPTQVTHTKEFVTGSDGKYKVPITFDSGDDVCDVVALNSSDPECSTPTSVRNQARVILTRNNGMASNARFANALGFEKRTPLVVCAQILQQYQESED